MIADASALTIVTGGRIRPPFSATASITSGHAVAACLAGEALDQRPVEQPAEHRHDEHEPDAEQRQMQAGCVPLLAELGVAGGQPGDGEDQLAKPGGAQARAAPTTSAITTRPIRFDPSHPEMAWTADRR